MNWLKYLKHGFQGVMRQELKNFRNDSWGKRASSKESAKVTNT